MQTTSQKAVIREMTPEQILEHAEQLYARCNCDVLSLTPDEHDELRQCAANYYHLTGESLPTPTFCSIS